MITVTTKVHFKRGPNGRKRIRKGEAPPKPKPRVPRIAKLMALAIRFDQLIREGKVWDQSDIARLAHVTQPRMTQIMNLLHLAPDIQEEILFLPDVPRGRDPIHEHMLRELCAEMDWENQRREWRAATRRTVNDCVPLGSEGIR